MKDIQSFLGFTNFYRKFIYWFLEITALLSNLIKKNKKFEWTSEEEKAFLVLKEIFTKRLILAIFNPAKKIIIETDTNKIALGLMLSQPDEKKRLYPVIFYSKKFTAPELNYDIHDKKLLIIVNNFKI